MSDTIVLVRIAEALEAILASYNAHLEIADRANEAIIRTNEAYVRHLGAEVTEDGPQ